MGQIFCYYPSFAVNIVQSFIRTGILLLLCPLLGSEHSRDLHKGIGEVADTANLAVLGFDHLAVLHDGTRGSVLVFWHTLPDPYLFLALEGVKSYAVQEHIHVEIGMQYIICYYTTILYSPSPFCLAV